MAGLYDEQILGARQQAETARKLREGINAPQGQMVSGWYVPPSATQYLAEGLRTYGAAKKERKAEAEAKRLQDLKQQQTQMYMNQMGPQADVSLSPSVTQNFGNPQAMADAFAQGGTQTTYTQPSEQQRMAALIRLSQVNPEAAQVPLQMQQYQMKADEAKQAKEEKFQQQQEMARLVAGLRPQQDKLVSVVGPNEQPMFVPQSAAAGMQPYIKPSGKSSSITPEQRESAALSAQQALNQLQTLYAHPGREAGTGGSSWMSAIPATDAKSFGAELKTFQAKAFLDAVQAMKGLGALTEAEGAKLVASIGALDPEMKEQDFANNLKQVAIELHDKAKAKGLDVQLPEFAAPQPMAMNNNAQNGGAKFLGFE